MLLNRFSTYGTKTVIGGNPTNAPLNACDALSRLKLIKATPLQNQTFSRVWVKEAATNANIFANPVQRLNGDHMSPSDLRAWKQRLGLTWAKAALATRIPESTLYDYLAGVYPIPADRALLLELVDLKLTDISSNSPFLTRI